MLAVQYRYFAAIKYPNAATATILQYAGPALIAIYVAFQKWKWFYVRFFYWKSRRESG